MSCGLTLKPSKCALFRSKVLYLGTIVNAAGVALDLAKLRVLSNWRVLTTVGDVKSILGFVNFYCDYIANFTEHTAPLYELTVGRIGMT